MKLGLVTKLEKRNTEHKKGLTMATCQQVVKVIVTFYLIPPTQNEPLKSPFRYGSRSVFNQKTATLGSSFPKYKYRSLRKKIKAKTGVIFYAFLSFR